MDARYTATEVLDLLEESDFGFSNSKSNESGGEMDGRTYSIPKKTKITSAELSFLKAMGGRHFQHSFLNVC